MTRNGFFLIGAVLVSLCAAAVVKAQSSGKAAGQAAAKSGVAATAAVPIQLLKKPKDLMVLAARTNGLAGLEDRPWHLKVMYQNYDGDGKPGHIGTLEEWWVSKTKYKYVYSGPDYTHTVVRDSDVWKWAGDEAPPPIPVNMVEGYLWTPLPPDKEVEKPYYYVQHRKFGQVALTCMQPEAMAPQLVQDAVTGKANVNPAQSVPTTCFSEGSSAARLEITGNDLFVVLNRIVEVDGHYIAKQIGLNDVNLPVATLNVMQLDFPKSIPDAVFTAPAGAHTKKMATAKVLNVKGGVMNGYRIGGEAISYPSVAKTEHVRGLVLLTAEIDETGSVVDLKAVIGPKLLREAAVKAVKTWKYKPYLLNGLPVKVQTQIDVVFKLSN